LAPFTRSLGALSGASPEFTSMPLQAPPLQRKPCLQSESNTQANPGDELRQRTATMTRRRIGGPFRKHVKSHRGMTKFGPQSPWSSRGGPPKFAEGQTFISVCGFSSTWENPVLSNQLPPAHVLNSCFFLQPLPAFDVRPSNDVFRRESLLAMQGTLHERYRRWSFAMSGLRRTTALAQSNIYTCV
jgi:hypothetical protein